MNKKISFYSNDILIFSLIVTTIFLYQIFIIGNENITFFIFIILEGVFTAFNSIYICNIKNSIIELLNLKKKRVYNKIFIEGMMCYSPILLSVIVYSFINYDLFVGIGILTVLNIVINIIIINKINNYNYYIMGFMIVLIVSICFFMRGIAYVIGS